MRLVRVVPGLASCLVLGASVVHAAPEDGKKAPPDPAKVFARKDADKDGSLTLEEFKTGLKEPALGKAEQRFQKLDSNGDGKVSLDECKANVKRKG